MNKIFRKSFLVSLSIFSISLFSIFMFAIIRAEITNLSEMNKFYTSSRVDLVVNSTEFDFQLMKEYMEKLTENNDIIIDLPGANDTEYSKGLSKGLYFSGEFGKDFKLLKGRMLNAEDMKSNEPVAVVGKEFEKYIIEKNQEEYIKLKGKEYKVVGIIGEKNIKNESDHMIFYNLNSVENPEFCVTVLNSKTLTAEEITKKIESVIAKEHINVINSVGAVYESPSKAALAYQAETIKPFILVIIAFICTLIRGLIFWIEKINLELGVRLTSGAKKIDILNLILKRFTVIYFVSSFLAILLAMIIQRIGIITIFDMRLDESIILLIAMLYIVLFITTIITVFWKILRLNPKKLIRG